MNYIAGGALKESDATADGVRVSPNQLRIVAYDVRWIGSVMYTRITIFLRTKLITGLLVLTGNY